MIYIALPDETQHLLSFYLAMEEYVARSIDCDDCFFMWQVDPSVIFGRNQLIETEVNVEYCKEHGIRMFRRKSGGGCVYADMSNVMFSYITKDEKVNFTFNKYINMVVSVLQKLGVDARATGRNDILVDGRKVSGNAFYHLPGRSIVHGTMLYDTNMQNMVGSITPSTVKLTSKGINSVRQRIALLKDYLDISIADFKRFVRENLCDGELLLTQHDVEEIKVMEKAYLEDEFIYGNNPRCTMLRKGHIEGVGDIEARIELKNDRIKDMTILGDYFVVGDVDKYITRPLHNVKLAEDDMMDALPEKLDEVIMNLKKKDFVDLILTGDVS